MEIIVRIIEVFALVSGLLYIILEIRQKNAMWVVGMVTGAACAFSFAVQHLYASMGLNIYYMIVSAWGLHLWRKGHSAAADKGAEIHLNRLTLRTVIWSALLLVAGSAALILLLGLLGGSESRLDAVVTVMSAVGTWWLAKSYPQQWLVWIVADLLCSILCFVSGMYWLAALYLVYAGAAVYGYRHWLLKGIYI